MPAFPWIRLADADPDGDYVIMASRLPLRRYRNIVGFLRATRAIRAQLAAAEGVVGYTLDAKPLRKTFWTLSAWESDEALDRFARTDPHRSRIADIRPHMLPTTFVRWSLPGKELPPKWAQARRRVEESVRRT
jgi:quinol monooxygenase YgiN